MDGKFLCRTLANGIQQYLKTMTKQGLFQNHKDEWISGNLLVQFIKTVSTALGPGNRAPPPALLLPKGKVFLWAKTCPVFLLPTRPHFWYQGCKVACPNGPKPISRAYTDLFPGSIPSRVDLATTIEHTPRLEGWPR